MTAKSIGQVANYRPLAQCGMEELAARQGTIAPSGGVLFARNGGGVEKDQARQRVLDLFSPSAWPEHLNMLTLPGLHWKFERQLLALRDPGWTRRSAPYRTHFTGIESDRSIYFASVTQMPGTETPRRLIKPIKKEKFPFCEFGVKTRHAAFFFANADDFIEHEFVPAHHERPGWDAAWLDYTGPLSGDRLEKIGRFFDKYIRRVLVLTALKARWNAKTSRAIMTAGGHSAWLRAALPGTVLHDIEYFDTSPMAQFAVSKLQEGA